MYKEAIKSGTPYNIDSKQIMLIFHVLEHV